MNASADSLLVIGPGYIGLEAALNARAEGARVYVLCRNPRKIPLFEEQGLHPLAGDLLNPESLPSFPPVKRVLFSIAPDRHEAEDYEAVYVRGLRAALQRLQSAEKMIWISSTSVWAETPGWVNEQTEPHPANRKGQILLEAEKFFLSSPFPGLVFRLSGIYGPGRNRAAAFREGRWPETGTPLRYLNVIHRDDIVRGIRFLFERGAAGEVYLGTDNEPFLNRDLALWLQSRISRESAVPVFLDGIPGGKRCRNQKLKALGFEFLYPSFREGYEAILAGGEPK